MHLSTPSTRRTPPAGHAQSAARAQAAWDRGRAAYRAGSLREARTHFETATRLWPGDALYWLNLARCEQKLGLHDQALDHAERSFALDGSSLVACNLLAEMLRDQQRHDEVLRVLQRLDPKTSRDARWFLLCGGALFGQHQFETAAHAFLHGLSCTGDDVSLRRRLLLQLGHCFGLMKRHLDGAQCYRMLLDADPLALGSALYAAHFSSWACDWPAMQQDLDRLAGCVEAFQAGRLERSPEAMSPFCAINLVDDAATLRWLSEIACAHSTVTPTPPPPRSQAPVPRPGGRIRIGWISSDFHQHATSILLAEVLESIDPTRFELVFYSGGPDDRSPMRQRVLATASQVHEVSQWSADRLAEQVRADQIGILLDLKGFTFGTRLAVFAQRPAPLQVAWLGYPGTTGAPFIDYIVGDETVTPLDAQPYYTEQIAQLPGCYQPNDSHRTLPARLPREACGLPPDSFVFASFNQSYKIMPAIFAAWCNVLQQVPNAVLWLLVPQADTQQRLLAAAAQCGLGPERFVFAPFVPAEQHRARLPNADLFLDTYPCGGHTTASDALWAGVPVLTLMGQTFASRVAASLVRAVGCPELACENLDQFVETAVHYATDPAARRALRDRVEAARGTAPLFDGRRFARDFERLLLRMVERQDAGLPPCPLPAAHAEEPAR